MSDESFEWDIMVPREIEIHIANTNEVIFTLNPPNPCIPVLFALLENDDMQLYKKALGFQTFNAKLEQLVCKMIGDSSIKRNTLRIYSIYFSFQDLVGHRYIVTLDYTKLFGFKKLMDIKKIDFMTAKRIVLN